MKTNAFFSIVLFIILTFFAFWRRGIILLDPDFGWHLRMGEIIQKTGIPKTDPFSYTMPSYPFVDHEWLTNVILSKLYPFIDITGLAVIFSLIATLAILIQIPFPLKKWSFVPFVLVAGSLLGFVGVRPQIISWLFFSILIFILFNRKTGKWRFVLPLIFFVWTNLHGGFGMGIVVLLIAMALRIWEQKKFFLTYASILLFSIVATLVSPYGVRLWRELWMSLSDTSLRWSISEWMPAFYNFNFTLWVFVSLSLFLILRYRKKFSLSQLVLYFILLIAGISSIRHMPFFLLFSLPMTINAIYFFTKQACLYKEGQERLNKVYAVFGVFVALFVIVEGAVNINGAKSLQEESFYPKGAAEFLTANKSCGQLFSIYGWGGYLIWKLPEKKVFIDGRMPSWRLKAPFPSESNYAFEEHNNVFSGKLTVNYIVAKYNIDTFLLPVEKKKEVPIFLKGLQYWLETLLNRKTDDYGALIKKIKDNGMVEVYKDNTAVIYRQRNYQKQCIET